MSALYVIGQCVWGFPQTLAGGVLFLLNAAKPHFIYNGAVVTRWGIRGSVSLGEFIFMSDKADDTILAHEYGHTVQSLILGPLYLLVIGLPSIVWAGFPLCVRYRKERNYSYYRFYTERWANWHGDRVYRKKNRENDGAEGSKAE